MIRLSKNQQDVLEKAVDWYHNSSESTFQITGNPGCGKTVLLHAIVEALKLPSYKVAPMTYTGASAINMRRKGFSNARTIHSWLLEPVDRLLRDKQGRPLIDTYFNIPEWGIGFIPKPLVNIDLIVIDEGGMVPIPMRKLIEDNHVKTLVAGDIDQLKPVGYDSAYLTSGELHRLTEIFRQGKQSGIVYVSQRILHDLPIHQGFYGDCMVIYDDEVTSKMIKDADLLICAKNNTREELTNLVRHSILHIDGDYPIHGEKVVCRQNNWQLGLDGINLANGLMGTISNYPDVTRHERDYFSIDFKPNGMTSVFEEVKVNKRYFFAPFKDKITTLIPHKSQGNKFEYAYAITTHIAQGSEAPNIVCFQEYMSRDMNKSLWYTGITRASKSCIFVKKKRKHF